MPPFKCWNIKSSILHHMGNEWKNQNVGKYENDFEAQVVDLLLLIFNRNFTAIRIGAIS